MAAFCSISDWIGGRARGWRHLFGRQLDKTHGAHSDPRRFDSGELRQSRAGDIHGLLALDQLRARGGEFGFGAGLRPRPAGVPRSLVR